MPDLTPMTRQEKFLNGDTDLEPITRREHFYAGRESELPEGHQEPETREEWFIQKYRGGGGGDITVESLSVTSNGTYTAPSGKAYSPVNVNVPLPENAYLNKSLTGLPADIATFNDGEALPLSNLKVAIEPQQDLHGYDSPWVGGAGKNKLPLILDNIKANNTSGTWNGNTYVHPNGITFNIITNNSGAIEKIVATGTASGTAVLLLDSTTFKPWTGTFIINGCIEGSGSTYFWDMQAETSGNVIDYDGDTSFVPNQNYRPRIVITSGYQCPTNGITFKPMVRLASVSDDTFAPYSNICPITGYTEANVTVADDVETPTVSNVYTIDLDGTRYGGELDVINGIGREYKEYPSYNGETLIGPWISDRDVYAEGTTPTIGAQVLDKGDITTFNTIPTAVKSLRGGNNVFANTGDIKNAEYFSKEV